MMAKDDILSSISGSTQPRRRRRCAAAFTLTELMVSIGILAVMMTMAGMVFKLTLESTGDATSLMEVAGSMRTAEQTLREDLAGVDQTRSMLVIVGFPVNAYWRTEHVEADADGLPETGYPHQSDPEREEYDATTRSWILDQPRADRLMFFTNRQANSAVYPAIESSLVQVVYGHAELGEIDPLAPNGDWRTGTEPLEFPDDSQTVFTHGTRPVAAQDWHLARRSVLVLNNSLGVIKTMYGPYHDELDQENHLPSDPGGGGDSDIYEGRIDLLDSTFSYHDEVLEAQPDGAAVKTWYARSQLDLTPPASLSLPDGPVARLGHYFLPHCASFKVEWALDLRDFVDLVGFDPRPGKLGSVPQELIWFDPARHNAAESGQGANDPLGELDELAAKYEAAGCDGCESIADGLVNRMTIGASPPRDDLKYQLNQVIDIYAENGLDGPQVYTWAAKDKNGEPVEKRFWPQALRITIDVYDRAGNLETPYRQVFVLPVGRQ